MIRFPYTLQIWDYDSKQWVDVCKCNARTNTKAQEIQTPNGKFFRYAYEVVMPANVEPIEEDSEARIIDSHGKNIFDYHSSATLAQTLEDSVSRKVLGFYKSGQRYEYTKLWL